MKIASRSALFFLLVLVLLTPPGNSRNKPRKPKAFQQNLLKTINVKKPSNPVVATQAATQNDEGAVVNSGQSAASSATAQPHMARGEIYSKPPAKIPDEEQPELEAEIPVPQGRIWSSIPKPTVPESRPNSLPDKTLPAAPNDFKIQFLHDLTGVEVGNRSTVNEPSLGNMGDTIFYSANWFAARSTNGGSSFTFVSPYTTFPSVNGGFCCDQVVNFARNQNMMLWGLQYIKDSSSGTFRIARAIGPGDVANNLWTYYDFTPQFFGWATGNWLDFPNLTISGNYLYATSNVFTTSADAFAGAIIWRISLAQLAAGGNIPVDYFAQTRSNADVGGLRCTDGATTTMYWAGFRSTSQLRIFRWDDGGTTIFWDDVNLNAFTFLQRNGVAVSPDGTNWAARADTRISGGFVAGVVIGFLWPAKQDATFPYPYTIVGRFNQSNRTLISQQQIWNNTFAWLYGTANVNSAGNIGGVLNYGGGTLFPNTALYLVDDVTPSFAPLTSFVGATSTAGPTNNAWGDYLTTRVHKDWQNSYVVGAHYLLGTTVIPSYYWFGRERDLPPPSCPTITSINPTNGIIGSTMTITGNNFTGVTAVKFTNNLNAAFTINSNTQITATVPSGAVSGPITISKTSCPDVQTGTFTIGCNLAPIALGQTINGTLTASGCAGHRGSGDQYSFTASSGQQVSISLSSANFDTYLYLIAPNGTILSEDDDGGGGASGTDSRIPPGTGFLSLPTAGTYIIEASSFTGTSTGNYTLSLTPPCTYAVSPPTANFTASGGNGNFTVTTTPSTGCSWTASSNVSWITTSSTGTGTGTANYTVAANPTSSQRTGTVTVQGQTHTVTQDGTTGTCVPVSISTSLTGASGTPITVPITVGSLTGLNALSYDFTLAFDPAVISPQNPVFDAAGTLSSGLTITANTSVSGRVTISAFSANPLSGSGTLLNLKFNIIGAGGTATNLTWNSFAFNEATPCSSTSNGRIMVVSNFAISGTVTYCAASPVRQVPNATLNLTGTQQTNATTNASGFYQISGLVPGNYTLTPVKTGAVSGISGFDAALVAQYAAGLITLSSCQQTAADASNNGSVTTFDAALIAQTVAGIQNPGIAGTWKFVPANRTYANVSTDQTNQNFDAILVGDVSGNWTPASPFNFLDPLVSLTLQGNNRLVSKSLTLPIVVGDVTERKPLSFDFTLNYDPNILQPDDPVVDTLGTLSQGMFVTVNSHSQGRILVSAFGITPLSGSGVLLNLKFKVVGKFSNNRLPTLQTFSFNEDFALPVKPK